MWCLLLCCFISTIKAVVQILQNLLWTSFRWRVPKHLFQDSVVRNVSEKGISPALEWKGRADTLASCVRMKQLLLIFGQILLRHFAWWLIEVHLLRRVITMLCLYNSKPRTNFTSLVQTFPVLRIFRWWNFRHNQFLRKKKIEITAFLKGVLKLNMQEW